MFNIMKEVKASPIFVTTNGGFDPAKYPNVNVTFTDTLSQFNWDANSLCASVQQCAIRHLELLRWNLDDFIGEGYYLVGVCEDNDKRFELRLLGIDVITPSELTHILAGLQKSSSDGNEVDADTKIVESGDGVDEHEDLSDE